MNEIKCALVIGEKSKVTRGLSSVLESEQLVASIHSQADILFQSWTKTQTRIKDWQKDINDTRQVSAGRILVNVSSRRQLSIANVRDK